MGSKVRRIPPELLFELVGALPFDLQWATIRVSRAFDAFVWEKQFLWVKARAENIRRLKELRQKASRGMVISGLGPWASVNWLVKEFGKYGRIESFHYDGGTQAFIRFSKVEEAINAALEMDNFLMGTGDQRILLTFDRDDKVEDKRAEVARKRPTQMRHESEEAKRARQDMPSTSQSSSIETKGFGTDIEWVPWEQAVSVALDLNRPIFLLIHKSWCGACDALKKSFATSPQRKELLELSKHFVMANTEDEEEPEEEEYAPDGRYIPRLFLLNKHGVRLPVDNKKNYPSNIAYFPQVPDVIRAMKLGLEEFEKDQKGAERAEEGESVVEKEKKAEKGEKEEGKKKKTDTESTLEKKKTKKDESKAEDEAGKGGCPHAAGKAAAKRKKEEEERKKQTKEKSTEKKEAAEKKAGGGKEKSTGKKETDSKKAEQQKKIKGAEKEKEEL